MVVKTRQAKRQLETPGGLSPAQQQQRRGGSTSKRSWRSRWGDLLGKANNNSKGHTIPLQDGTSVAAPLTLDIIQEHQPAIIPRASGADRQLLPSKETDGTGGSSWVDEIEEVQVRQSQRARREDTIGQSRGGNSDNGVDDSNLSTVISEQEDDHSRMEGGETIPELLSGFLHKSTRVEGIQRVRSGLVSHASSEGASSSSTILKSNKGSPGSSRRRKTSRIATLSSPRASTKTLDVQKEEDVNPEGNDSLPSSASTKPLEDLSEGAQPIIHHSNEQSEAAGSSEVDYYGLLNDMGTPKMGSIKKSQSRPCPRRNSSVSSFTTCSIPLSPCSSFNSKDLDYDFDSVSAGSTQRTKGTTATRSSMPSLSSYSHSSSDSTTLSGSDTKQSKTQNQALPTQLSSKTNVISEESMNQYASSFTSLSVELNEPQPTSELTLFCNASNSSFSKDETEDHSATRVEGSHRSDDTSTQRSHRSSAISMPSLASISSSEITSSSSSAENHLLHTNKKQPSNRSSRRSTVPIIPEEKADPIIPEEKADNYSSFTSISVELNDPQPASELTLMCMSNSSISKTDEVSSPSERSSSSGPTESQSSSSPPVLTSSSDSNDRTKSCIDHNISFSSQSMSTDSKSLVSIHQSILSGQWCESKTDQDLKPMLSLNNSKGSLQSVASSPADSRHSTTSLIGQHLINSPELDNWASFNSFTSGSMAYSETSDTSEPVLDSASIPSAKESIGTTESSPKPASHKSKPQRRRRGSGATSGASVSSRVSSGSQFTLKKKEPMAPYDGALLHLVDSMHGSGSTVENLNESLSSFQTSHSTNSFHSRRGSFASTTGSKHSDSRRSGHIRMSIAGPPPRSEDYVSSASSASSFWNDDTSAGVGSNSKMTIGDKKKTSETSRPTETGKTPRRRSGGSNSSSGSSSVTSSQHSRHPPHKQPRRHSLGCQIPARSSPSPNRRGSMASDSGISKTHKEPTSKRGNSLSQYIARQMERGDSGYFSGASSQERHESRSIGSPMNFSRSKKSLEFLDESHSLGTPIELGRSKKSLDMLDESRSLSSLLGSPAETTQLRKTYDRGVDRSTSPVYHRGVRSASPVQTSRKLNAEDLAQSRFSAPPRLGRIRSPRRRIIHLASHLELERSGLSQGSSGRLSSHSQRSQKSLSLRNLEESQRSARSLPPRSPGLQKSPFGKSPVDPAKEKTVRRGNRTVDLIPEVNNIKQGRRRSWNNSASERRYRIIGLPPFVEDNEDLSVSSGSTSDSSDSGRYSHFLMERERESMSQMSTADSMGRMSWVPEESVSSHKTMQAFDDSPLPPRHRHIQPSLRTILSEASLSEEAATSSSDHGRRGSADTAPSNMEDGKFANGKTGMERTDNAPTMNRESAMKRQVTRMNSVVSATTAVSNTSYDLQPVHLVIPGSPDQPSLNSDTTTSGISTSTKTSPSDDSTQSPFAPPLYRIGTEASTQTGGSRVTTRQLATFPHGHGQLREDSSDSSASSSSRSSALFPTSGGELRQCFSTSALLSSDLLGPVPGTEQPERLSSTSLRFQSFGESSGCLKLHGDGHHYDFSSSHQQREDSSPSSASSSSSSQTRSTKDDGASDEWFPREKEKQTEAGDSPRKMIVSPPDSPFSSFNEKKPPRRQQQQRPQAASSLTVTSPVAPSIPIWEQQRPQTPSSVSPASQAIWDKLTLEKGRQQKIREKLRSASPIPMIHSPTE